MVKIVYAFFYAISLLPFRLLYCIADFEYFMMYRVEQFDSLEEVITEPAIELLLDVNNLFF